MIIYRPQALARLRHEGSACRQHFGGSKSSSSSSQTTTNQYDQRQIHTTTIDDRDQYQSYDLSDRSTTYVQNADAAAVNKQNTDMLRDLGAEQTDAIKTIAGFGDNALRRMGESATSLYQTSGANAVRTFEAGTKASTDAWNATLERSTGLIDSMLKGATNTVNAARDISQQAITSYMPTDNKAQDSLKWGYVAAAAVVGLVLFSKGKN